MGSALQLMIITNVNVIFACKKISAKVKTKMIRDDTKNISNVPMF